MCVFVWFLASAELVSLSPSNSSPDVQSPQSYDASALLHFSIKPAGMKKRASMKEKTTSLPAKLSPFFLKCSYSSL